jgi:glutaminyl-peptide cyclotransferase
MPIPYFCHMKMKHLLYPLTLVFFAACTDNTPKSDDHPADVSSTPSLSYSILSTLPHDTSYFTEGIEFYHNTLLESTGLNGKSRLVQYDPVTQKVLQQAPLEAKYFGEGITVLRDTLYQLTYREQTAFMYDVKSFKKLAEFHYTGEGWGFTNDGTNLIMSNGSSSLFYYQPGTFKMLRELPVRENNSLVPNINELEYVNGFIYANQWQYDYLLKIDPKTGKVVAKIDLGALVTKVRSDGHSEFLNGIAYNKETNKFYITGKNWPQLFEIQFDR